MANGKQPLNESVAHVLTDMDIVVEGSRGLKRDMRRKQGIHKKNLWRTLMKFQAKENVALGGGIVLNKGDSIELPESVGRAVCQLIPVVDSDAITVTDFNMVQFSVNAPWGAERERLAQEMAEANMPEELVARVRSDENYSVVKDAIADWVQENEKAQAAEAQGLITDQMVDYDL